MLNTSHSSSKLGKTHVYSLKNNEFVGNSQLFGKSPKYLSPESEYELNDKTAEKIFKNNLNISQKLLAAKAHKLNNITLPSITSDLSFNYSKPCSQELISTSKPSKHDLNSSMLMHQAVLTTSGASPTNTSPSVKQSKNDLSQERKFVPNARTLQEATPQLKARRETLDHSDLIDYSKLEKEVIARNKFEIDRQSMHSPQNLKRDVSYLFERRKMTSPMLEVNSPIARNTQLSAILTQNQSYSSGINARGSLETKLNKTLSRIRLGDHLEQPSPISASRQGNAGFPSFDRQDRGSLPLIFHNATPNPFSSSATSFSKTFYPDNRFDKLNSELNISDLRATEYREHLKEVSSFLGESNNITHIFPIPKITSEGNPIRQTVKTESDAFSFHWDEVLDDAELQALKKELPSIFAGGLPNRTDVVSLTHWVEEKINSIVNEKNISESEKCKKCDGVYNIALNEVVRQISIDCVERGNLLYKIWMSYLRIFQNFRQQLIEKEEHMNDHFEDTYNRVHKMYREMIAEKDIKVAQCEKEFSSLKEELGLTSQNLEQTLKKNEDLSKINSGLRKVIERMKLQNKILQNENDTLAYRLGGRQLVGGKSQGGQTPLANTLSRRGTHVNGPMIQLQPQQPDEPKRPEFSRQTSRTSSVAHLKPSSKPTRTEIDENDEEEGTVSEESSENLEFEDQDADGEKKEVFKVDQLNNVFIGTLNSAEYKDTREIGTDTRELEFYELVYRDSSCQTDLNLVDKTYDNVMSNQLYLDELVTEHRLKQEVDIMAAAAEFKRLATENSEVKEGENEVPPKVKKSKSTIKAKAPASNDHRKTHSVGQSGKESELDSGHEQEDPYLIETGLKRIVEQQSAESPDGKNRSHGNSFANLEDQQEQKEGDLEVRGSMNSVKDISKRRARTVNTIAEAIENSILKDSDQKVEGNDSLSIGARAQNQSKDQSNSEHNNQSKSLNSLDNELKTTNEVLQEIEKRKKTTATTNPDGILKKKKVSHRIDLNEIDPDEIYEEGERPSRTEVGITSETFHDQPDTNISIVEEEEESSSIGSQDIDTPSSDMALPQKRKKTGKFYRRGQKHASLGDMAAENPTYRSMTQYPRNNPQEQVSFNESESLLESKAQYLQIIRMYKVEVEKVKLLQNTLVDLKQEYSRDKNVLNALTEENKKLIHKIEELTGQLEKATTKCKHGGCALCKKEEEEEKAELEMAEAIDEAFDGTGTIEEVLPSMIDTGDGSPRRRQKKVTFTRNNRKLTTTTTQNVMLGRRLNVDKKNNPAPLIIAKLKQKKMSKFKNFMPLKMVLRQINQIYDERIKWSKESVVVKEEELNNFVYNLYLNNFGFKKIAEQKFIILVLSIKKYLHIVRINLFARFLGLLDGAANYTVDELNKYIECMEFLSTNTLGTTIYNSDTDSKHYAPYSRFQEYLKVFCENKIGIEEYLEFKKEFEPLKEVDPKNMNRFGIIDIDIFMTKILAKYRLVCNRTKQFVINAFRAADLDGDRMCNLREFILLYKYIEPEKFDLEFVETLFDDYADLYVDGERNFSFDKFTVICVEYNLFSDYQQDKFLMITKKEQLLDQLNDLKSRWLTIYATTEGKLSSLQSADKKIVEKWTQILQVLGQRIQAPTPDNLAEIKPLLIAMRIMEAEVNALVEKETEKSVDY